MLFLKKINRKFRIVNRCKVLTAKIFAKIFFLSFSNGWSVEVSQNLHNIKRTVSTKHGKLTMIASNWLTLYRAKTLTQKEPDTICWLDSMEGDSTLFDVGANVGIYSIYAAQKIKEVYSFEPIAFNYSILNQNILLNSFDKKIKAFCLAISNKQSFDFMNLSGTELGSSFHSFSANKDVAGKEFTPVFRQGAISYTLDQLVYKHNFPCPNYLKIDVDGLQADIINGANKLLGDKTLKSILLELNEDLEDDQKAMEKIFSSGFKIISKGDIDEYVFMHENMQVRNYIFERMS
jgi:FkbM family methyltransferase